MFDLPSTKAQFVIALTEHRMFGHILVPFLIEPNSQGTFYTIKAQVISQDVKDHPELFSSAEKKLVELTEKYSDESLARRFSKKYGSKTFFHNVDSKFFNEHITPFIDRQIVEGLRIIRDNKIQLFYKPAKYNNLYDEDLIEVGTDPAIPTFHFELNAEGLSYRLSVSYKNQNLKLLHKKPIMVTDSPCRMVLRNELIGFEKLSGKRLSPFFEKETVKIPLSVVEKYMKSFVYGLVKEHNVEAKGFDIVNLRSKKNAIISIETGLEGAPILVLKFQYGTKRFQAGRSGRVEVEFKSQGGKYFFYRHQRDPQWEESVHDFLKTLGLSVTGNMLCFSTNSPLVKDDPRYAIVNWTNEYHDKIKKFGILLEQHFGETNFYTGSQQLDVNVKMEGDWFDLYAVVTFDEFKIPFIRLKRNILQGKREYVLPNGKVAILPLEWFVKYREIMPFADKHNDELRLAKHHFALISEKIEETDLELKEKVDAFMKHQFEKLAAPKGLKATLRHYQEEGFSWMQTLANNNFGGCLADDMGLGKTLQTLTLLLNQKNEKSQEAVHDFSTTGQDPQLFSQQANSVPASLIIVPTSLVHNWKNEIKKFAPQLKVYQHIGTQRKRVANLKGVVGYYDIILTTYGTIRNDVKLLSDLTFNYLILDESQNIKNSGSKTYKAVCEIQSKHRLVLTGTPIENSLTDLWSQLNFLNPGLLGSLQFFKKEYIQAIEKANDEEKQKQLYKLISPFILRRTKEQVAKDLPPLTEHIRYCQMTDAQAKIYEEQKSSIRNSLLENIEKQGVEKSTFLALQGLTRLRQLANHPALNKYSDTDSGKFNEVMKSMEDLMAEHHKVLIFSSFVSHLKLFQTEFENRGWEYSLLTGQTRDRESVINDFQQKERKRIFLISLKAGGVGLNLTSADYIFILDPWWNPAAENQAVNRAHRIGQDKKVFVYRFITEETIEEKIQVLKERKMALAEQFITTNNPFQSISKDEMVELFS